MKLIKDLGKRLVGKHNRRFGLFHCNYCGREVEKRYDSGSVYKSCGCLDRRDTWNTFETWKCTKCNIVKPLTEYYKNTTGYRRECKHCVKEKQLLYKYNVDYKWYEKKLKEQGGLCDICKKPLDSNHFDKLSIDHNHTTGELRGLLCNRCNTALGLLKEDIPTINNLITYINKYK